MILEKKIGIIGVGNMGTALLKGWLETGLADPGRLYIFDTAPERLEIVREQYRVQATQDSQELMDLAEVVILATKPHVFPTLLEQIKSQLRQEHLVISIAAGIPLSLLADYLPNARIIRVMPNTPTMVQVGMAALAPGRQTTAEDLQLALTLFNAVGRAVVVEERLLDAVTGLSGSGPAYVFIFLEALADGGVKMGLPRDVALVLAGQMVLGAAQLLLQSEEHPGSLKDAVTSPGGTTIAGLHVLEQGGFRGLVMSAVEAATKRAQELGKVS
jgi:pyrroline-5-carboxylate reductase